MRVRFTCRGLTPRMAAYHFSRLKSSMLRECRLRKISKMMARPTTASAAATAERIAEEGAIEIVAELLFTRFVLPFEVISILLMVRTGTP